MKLEVYAELTQIIDKQNKLIESLILKMKEQENLIDELLKG